MDKNKIKSFAIWARRNLIAAVSEKANRIGIWENKIEEAIPVQGGFKLEGKDEIFPLSKSHRDALVNQVREKGFEQVMEEVAYTWFNRFMGLRYMEVNDYLPTGVRILSSSVEGKVEPDVLTKVSEIIDELGLNANEIYDLLDTGDTLDREKAYRIILVKQCNELGKIIPQMFEKISDYTELLLPDNLLEEGSVIRKMVEDIEESDWLEEVEIIGWMYQYYISEKKDEVFAALKKNVKITKENIPAATQLFTPKWIVKYMVENSLGRLWLEGHPNEELQKEWKYYLEEAEQEPEVEEELKKIREEHAQLKPEDIKVLDPCMGSGHILVYAFDVLYEIYKTAGYSEREIPRLILQNNIYGLDIDDRAAQLASFALIMKARHYNRRLFREIEREHLELNLCSIQESNAISEEVIEYFDNGNRQLKEDIEYLVRVFTDAKEYGSILEVQSVNFQAIRERLSEIQQEQNLMFEDYRRLLLDKLPTIVKQCEFMSRKYEVCITNPPYVGKRNGMNSKLSKYLEKNYENTKNDLCVVFIEKGLSLIKKNCYLAMITQQSWMFLDGFDVFRKEVIKNNNISNMIHLGAGAFEEISGEVVQTTSFVLNNRIENYRGTYFRLVDEPHHKKKEKDFLCGRNKFNCTTMENYKDIKGYPIVYWINDNIRSIFKESISFSDYAVSRAGLSTGQNDIFIRNWTEVDYNKIGFGYESSSETENSIHKWFPCNNGGVYKKWYGNNDIVIDWENNGYRLKNFRDSKGKMRSAIRNSDYYFKEGITWTKRSPGNFAVRIREKGFIFEDAGRAAFIENGSNNLKYLLGLLSSKVAFEFLKMLNPTMNFTNGDIDRLPILGINSNIDNIVDECVNITRDDWNDNEKSWEFKKHPFIYLAIDNNNNLNNIYNLWSMRCKDRFERLKEKEEELNEKLINIYGLSNEISKDVSDSNITISLADKERDVKSFISYVVGCIFGRYSIDADGLIYAGGDFNDIWDIDNKKVRKIVKDKDGNILSDLWVYSTFTPDSDNIIPITEDEYFEDDIVSRFTNFIKVVYGDDKLEENLDFIADAIGRKSFETARQAIRRYFLKEFFKEHLKVYKTNAAGARPIYWMFESGKNDGFKCLIYMHRYNEQTVAKVRTDYLHILQRKYEAEINRLQLIVDSEEYTAKDRTAAKKKIDRISKQLEECKEYDQVVAYLANEKISIDLDDGVKVNYAKFQDVKVINSKGKEVKMNLLSKI